MSKEKLFQVPAGANGRPRAQSHCPRCYGTVFVKAHHGEQEAAKTGDQLIALERIRQVQVKGRTAEHDDGHAFKELAQVAAELAADGTDCEITQHAFVDDVWGLVKKYKHDRIQQLVVAGALIAAEIDRLLRVQKASK